MKPALVVVANSTRFVSIDPSSKTGINVNDWAAGLQGTLNRFDAFGVPVLLLRDTPVPGFDVPTCLARSAWRGADPGATCTFDRAVGLSSRIFEREEEVALRYKDVRMTDLSLDICPEERCRVFRNRQVLFFDDDHLTAGFSESLAPVIADAIDAALHYPVGNTLH